MTRYQTRARQFAAIADGLFAAGWTRLGEQIWFRPLPEFDVDLMIEQSGGNLNLRLVPVDCRSRFGTSIGETHYVAMQVDDLPGNVLRIVPAMVRRLCVAITEHVEAAS